MRIPRVTVSLFNQTTDPAPDPRWVADCECGWIYRNLVKTDVVQHAAWHRAEHRARMGADQ